MEKRSRTRPPGPAEPAQGAARPKATAKAKPAARAPDAAPAAFPAALDPVVVVPVKKLPPGRWLHEFKLDGYRILARIDGDGVRLFGRRSVDWTARLPGIAAALKKVPRGTWIDGVVTWEDDAGNANFARLSNGGLRDAANVTYRVFDLPFLAQQDMRLTTLDTRKARLHELVASLRTARVQPVDEIEGDENTLLAQACERGLEGIVSKERDSAYFGMRAGTWVKHACIGQDAFLVLGIAPEQGVDGGFAIHVGHRSIGGLTIYDGLVISGFDAD
ncbi:MAG: ligD, partial [Rhodospirillales bacterium]|nr:ligD [Rhodospirillales bacterium]